MGIQGRRGVAWQEVVQKKKGDHPQPYVVVNAHVAAAVADDSAAAGGVGAAGENALAVAAQRQHSEAPCGEHLAQCWVHSCTAAAYWSRRDC